VSLASWQPLLEEAYGELEEEYRAFLEANEGYFPRKEQFFNAFASLPRQRVKYILFGQDPYPREQSASGYAFIDSRVESLFGEQGLSTEVNRATSLRNFIKMLLVACGKLDGEDTSQKAIKAIDREGMIETMHELRLNFEANGVLLLNTALIFTDKSDSKYHSTQWRPFMKRLLEGLEEEGIALILFGNYAKELEKLFGLEAFEKIAMEHPYNHTFITNEKALKSFRGMHLLLRTTLF
jgi:uracil-DNA glycosylase